MIENAKAKTYKIVGRTERPSRGVEPYTAPGYTFITKITEKSKEKKNIIYMQDIQKGFEKSV